MSSPISVAIIGYGSSARTFHIPFVTSLPDLYNLHTIQQRPTSNGPSAKEAHPNVHIAPSFESVFDNLPPKSLVIITTSNDTHCDFALQTMKKGHHVVVEKPAALNVTDAESLAKASKENQVVCSAFQNRRLDNDFLTLQSLLAPSRNGQPSPIGQPTLVESRFDRYRPYSKGGWREQETPETGGGMLWDLGAHLIDQAMVLFGPPEKVTAFAHSARGQLSSKVDDDFLVHLHYPTSAPLGPESLGPAPGTRIAGPRVSVGASCLSAHIDAEQPRWRVEGTRGSFEKRGTDPQENQLKAGWTPASHADAFGLYDDGEPDSLRLGRLTTAVHPTTTNVAASSGGAPVQPTLTSSNIPMLPGNYIFFLQNISQTIKDVEAAREAKGDTQKALSNLFIKPEEIVLNTKCILLARKSAQEGKTLSWE